jgi:transcriptional regulator with XRE-family HTH domain
MFSIMNRGKRIGPRLRDIRKAAGVSGVDVAAAIGYSPSAVANFEAGRRGVDEDVAAAYLAYLAERVTSMHRRNLLIAAAGVAGAVAVPAADSLAGLVSGALAAAAPTDRDAWESHLAGRFATYLVDVERCAEGVVADLGYLQGHAGPLASVTARTLALWAQTAGRAEAPERWTAAAAAADQSGERDVRVWTAGRGALDLAYDLPTVAQALGFADKAIEVADGRASLGTVFALLAHAHIAEATGAGDPVRYWYAALDEADRLTPEQTATSSTGSGWSAWRTWQIGAHLAAKLGEVALFEQLRTAWERDAPAERSRFGAHLDMYGALLHARLGEHETAAAAADAALAPIPTSNRSASLLAMRAEIAAAA